MPGSREPSQRVHRISVDGAELHVEVAGEGDPVLMIHGNGADAAAFAPLVSHVSAERRVLAYDRRSLSRSSGAPGVGIVRHARDAAALLEWLGDEPSPVVGWSSGGVVALHLALERPERVSRLVLVEPSLLVRAFSPVLLSAMARCRLLRLLRGAEDGAAAFYRWVTAYRGGAERNAFDDLPEVLRSRMRANGEAAFAEMRPGGGSGGEYRSATWRRSAARSRWSSAGAPSRPSGERCASRSVTSPPRGPWSSRERATRSPPTARASSPPSSPARVLRASTEGPPLPPS